MKAFDLLKSPLEGATLLEASAGTGKTYTIAGLFLRLILEKELRVDQVLVVTYTVAATEELRDRIRTRLRDGLRALSGEGVAEDDELLQRIAVRYGGDERAAARLHRAITGFDEAAVYTIHGFCQRMLLENAFESSALFDTELVTDTSDLLREIIDDFWRRNLYNAHPVIAQYVMESLKYDALRALAGRLSIDPTFTIVPEEPPPDMAEITAMVGSMEDSFSRCGEIWKDSGKDVSDLLVRCAAEKKLSGQTYNVKHIPKRVECVETYLSGGSPMAKAEYLEYFTAEKLSSAARNADVPCHEFFDRCGELMRLRERLGTLLDRYVLSLKNSFLSYVHDELRRRKRDTNVRAFDDLLEDMYGAIRGRGGKELARSVRKKFMAALIDEFQDTDSLQYGIFTGLFDSPEHVLYLIGDPKQAIYRFRGADVFAYMQAAARIKSRATLGTNFRSDPGLIKAVNTIFSRAPRPFVFDERLISFTSVVPANKAGGEALIVEEGETAPFRIWYMGRGHADDRNRNRVLKPTAESLAARATATEIARLLGLGRKGKARVGKKNLEAGDIAVLVRKKSQARLMQEELRRLGIPGVLHGAESVFLSLEALEMERIMVAAAEPGSDARIKAALGTCMLGRSGNEIHRLMEDETKWERLAERFNGYHELWARYGFMRMFRALMEDEDVRGKLITLPDGERRVTNVLHLAELIHVAEGGGRLGFEGLLRWFAEKRRSGEDADELEQRLETDEQAVKLVTVHRSKGLEYPIVFCPFTWDIMKVPERDFSFHAAGKGDGAYALTLDIGTGSGANHRMAVREDLAENVRLLYVAVTRAKHRCYMVWGRINESEDSAPAYIFHQPAALDPVDPSGGLKKHVEALGDEEIISALEELSAESGGNIALSVLPTAEAAPLQNAAAESAALSRREFHGGIRRDWAVTSYTALTSGAVHDAGFPDHDETGDSGPPEPEAGAADSIFAFPRGAAAGTCIHGIFEELDYAKPDHAAAEKTISEKLSRYGFDMKWRDVLLGMVERVLQAPLDPKVPGLRLGALGRNDRINEMEFWMPLDVLDPRRLARVFAGATAGIPESIESLGFSPRGGYLRGFIDLVFRYGGRYYLADWKSNYLGGSVVGYAQDALARSMRDNYYFLQYHLYCAALHRYLNLRVPGYEYRSHFGGVFYIFVRGVDPAVGPEYGIYRDLPDPERVEILSAVLDGEKGARR